jgi:hypothetical protein
VFPQEADPAVLAATQEREREERREAERAREERLAQVERERRAEERQLLLTLMGKGDQGMASFLQMAQTQMQAEQARIAAESRDRETRYREERDRLEREAKERNASEERRYREERAVEEKRQAVEDRKRDEERRREEQRREDERARADKERDERQRFERDEAKRRDEERKDRSDRDRLERERTDKMLELERTRMERTTTEHRDLFDKMLKLREQKEDGVSKAFETFERMLGAAQQVRELGAPVVEEQSLGDKALTALGGLATTMGPWLAQRAMANGAGVPGTPPPVQATVTYQQPAPVPAAPQAALPSPAAAPQASLSQAGASNDPAVLAIANLLSRLTEAMQQQHDPAWSIGLLQGVPPVLERLRVLGSTPQVLEELRGLAAVAPHPIPSAINAFAAAATTPHGTVWVETLLAILQGRDDEDERDDESDAIPVPLPSPPAEASVPVPAGASA